MLCSHLRNTPVHTIPKQGRNGVKLRVCLLGVLLWHMSVGEYQYPWPKFRCHSGVLKALAQLWRLIEASRRLAGCRGEGGQVQSPRVLDWLAVHSRLSSQVAGTLCNLVSCKLQLAYPNARQLHKCSRANGLPEKGQ